MFLLLQCWCLALAIVPIEAFSPARLTCFRSGLICMSKNKDGNTAKGFKKPAVVVNKIDSANDNNVVSNNDKSMMSEKDSLGFNKMPAIEEDIDADAIFRKYKISDGQNLPPKKKQIQKKNEFDENAPFGRELMGNMSFEQQAKIDRILITCVFLALSFVILCGIAISFGAFRVVYPDVEISPTFDNIITNILDPAFTPALGVFFLFSTTFGLFKFAQISNSQTVYKE